MPSFFAAKHARTGLQNFEMDSPPNQSTPIKTIRSFDSHDQDNSPLAPFFKADREEKNRLRGKYTTDSGVFGSPTLRPSSAGGVPEHYNLRSESPLSWDSPHKGNGHFDARSELQRHIKANHQITRPPNYLFKWILSLTARIRQGSN
jgi:hypothetical protein